MNSKNEKLDYLEKERKLLWAEITMLKTNLEDIKTSMPEEVKLAKQASKMTAQYRNKALERKEEVDIFLDYTATVKNKIDSTSTLLDVSKTALESQIAIAESSANTLQNLEVATNSRVETIEAKILRIESILDEHPDLSSELENLDDTLDKINDTNNKVTAILRNSSTRKNEIDELYYEIAGNEETDEETGQQIVVTGLKQVLESQYDKLDEDLKAKAKSVVELKKSYDESIKELTNSTNLSVDNFIDGWTKKYKDYEETIEKLIPRALTAGLSGAFHDKREEEKTSFTSLRKQFIGGIIGLVVVSLIPFILSVIFLVNDESWNVVIDRAPKLVLAILPLYIPVLWLAYAANKKMNLSKRLIEEYSHKEVLSRTFYGLSNQIENTDDSEISSELRTRLLVNFLAVSAENPGKLISNYQESDHPVIEFLEKYGLDKFTKKKVNEVASTKPSKVKSTIENVADSAKKIIDTASDIAENNIK